MSSYFKFRYSVIFIDDCSRVPWVYLLQSRSDVFSIFKEFYMKIKTQFSVSIKTLRKNNALEFASSLFKKFCAPNDIIHQTSYAYTS